MDYIFGVGNPDSLEHEISDLLYGKLKLIGGDNVTYGIIIKPGAGGAYIDSVFYHEAFFYGIISFNIEIEFPNDLLPPSPSGQLKYVYYGVGALATAMIVKAIIEAVMAAGAVGGVFA